MPGAPDYFFEFTGAAPEPELGKFVSRLIDGERDLVRVADELSHRYEEIDLLYTISDVLGRTIGLEEAAQIIVREVSTVVGAQRASILVHDPKLDVLRPVAGWGIDVSDFAPIAVSDSSSVAATVFRRCRPVVKSEGDDVAWKDPATMIRPYRGRAFLSVPIVYPGPDGTPRPVGVVNLTDRLETDRFNDEHAKLITAIAHQIGAAIENARLVALDRQRQRDRHELELAHDLQLRLLPPTNMLAGLADVGARCRPAQSVGGDFYQFVRLPASRVGVMLGDVSSHGFPAALIMALVLSAAGIHAAAAESPETALQRLLASVRAELTETEMHLSAFYAVVNPPERVLQYANAGHPHAFRVPESGPPERLEASAPPLGLVEGGSVSGAHTVWRSGDDLLVLFSDGITEARNAAGEPFGEQRVLEIVTRQRSRPSQEIVEAVFAQLDRFAVGDADDRTLVVFKT